MDGPQVHLEPGESTAQSSEARGTQQVFFDPHMLVLEDCEDPSGEMRYQAIGFAGAQLLLLVVFADRSTEEQEIVRIISARKANDYEQSAYSDQF